MTPQDWQQVDAVVAEALELDEPKRMALVQERLSGRDELIAEAASLLAYDGDERPDPLVVPRPENWIGARVGPYRIVGLGGEGGMGIVWLAERDDGQFRRSVALKFLATLFPAGLALERFLMERDILASLDHPNIASLLDAGIAANGQPYLVMEWIDGKRIGEYCSENRLGPAAILRLFRQVCAAVDYAHRRLVIHRDLKPSNLLVTGDGQVKLLDFGVARMLEPGASDAAATATVGRALTLEYASPEHLRGDRVTTAVDIYSLGVMLYELLTGRRPYSVEGKTLSQIVEQTTRQEVPKVSRVRPGLAAELDAIAWKAMRPNPEERYGSAAELGADIDNFLSGRPVKARPAGAFYIARKFILRHSVATAASALALALIAGSAIVAQRERIRAEHRFYELRQLARAVMFDFQDGISLLPGTLEVRRQMVKRSIEYLDSLGAGVGADPQLLFEIGQGYHRLAVIQGKPSQANLGDFGGGLASIRKARRALETVLAARPRSVNAACELGWVLLDTMNIQSRVPGEDSAATRRSAVEYWENLARQYPDEDLVKRGLAAALFWKPDYRRALALYEELQARHPDDPQNERNIALLCRYMAEHSSEQEMRRLIDRAISIDQARAQREPLNRPAKLELSFDLSMLGSWYERTGQVLDAIRVFENVLTIREELVRVDPRDEQAKDRLLYVLVKLGKLQRSRGERAAARDYFSKSIELGEELSRNNPRPNYQLRDNLAAARDGMAWAGR